VPREAKLTGFLLLLAAIFLGAHAAGSALGPLTTSHSQVSYPGTTETGGGMNMGASGGQPVTPPVTQPAAARRGDGG
jgi:hypothetical protein